MHVKFGLITESSRRETVHFTGPAFPSSAFFHDREFPSSRSPAIYPSRGCFSSKFHATSPFRFSKSSLATSSIPLAERYPFHPLTFPFPLTWQKSLSHNFESPSARAFDATRDPAACSDLMGIYAPSATRLPLFFLFLLTKRREKPDTRPMTVIREDSAASVPLFVQRQGLHAPQQ